MRFYKWILLFFLIVFPGFAFLPLVSHAGTRIASTSPTWPDLIVCTNDTDGTLQVLLPDILGVGVSEGYFPAGNGKYLYSIYNGYEAFNADQTFAFSGGGYSNCEHDISFLKSNEQAYDLGFVSTTTTVSTTTITQINDPNRDYFYGVFLFFLLCGGVLFIFKSKI